MTRIYVRHGRRRYNVYIEDGKITVKRRSIINWNATAAEKEAVARLLAQVVADLWPQALKHEVLVTIGQAK